MFKRGFESITAWLMALVLAAVVYGIGYGAVKFLAARHASGQADLGSGHDAAPAGHDALEHPLAPEPGKAKDHDARGSEPHAPDASGHHGAKAPPKASSGIDHKVADHPASRPASAATIDAKEPSWAYKGSQGPAHWGELVAGAQLCKSGKAQSPIDLARATSGDKLVPVRFHYQAKGARFVNNGRFLRVVFDNGSQAVDFEGDRYELSSMEVHAPAEHRINGLTYELELALHHLANDGTPLTISILFEEGAAHKALDQLLEKAPMSPGMVQDIASLNPAAFLPERRSFFHYEGSLTSPPCTEKVTWLVMTHSLEVSARQIDVIMASAGGSSARPLQAVNGRRILKSTH